MRMRKKPNLIPRMERCARVLIPTDTAPERRGHWRELMPQASALHLELGCGKGRFTAETAAAQAEANTVDRSVPDRIPTQEDALTEAELEERAALRTEYIREFRASMTGILDNTVIVRPDGTREQVKDKNTKRS